VPDSPDAISVDANLFIEVRDRVYRYRVTGAVTSVGSARDNVVRIRDDSVTQHHLLLTWVDGDFFMRRVGDSPARLNGDAVENYSEELRFGDVIGLGDVRIRLLEGGRVADTAVMLLVHPRVEEDVRPWQVFVSRGTGLTFGEAPATLPLGGVGRSTIENLGRGAQYVVPPAKGGDTLQLNGTDVTRRRVLKDGDVLGLPGYILHVRVLRGEVMEEAENLLWPETLRRFSLPEDA